MDIEECLIIKHRSLRRRKKNIVSLVNSLVRFVVKKNHKVTKAISLNIPKHRTVYEQWIYNGYTTVEERI